MNKKSQLHFSIFQWIIVCIRAFCFISVLSWNYIFHYILPFLSSFIPFQIWKRYLSCMINLILNRIMFLIMGYFKFECQDYGFFNRDSKKILLKSGFIGLGTHKNFVDFLYYSYMFNPLFVKLILILQKQIVDEKEIQVIKEINYAPLNYSEALEYALQNRGFDPIIVRNEKQLKKIRFRKMNMKTLVSQSFQELKGCIFILLPGINLNQHVQIQQKIAQDVFDNQQKFLRSGVGLRVQFDERQVFAKTYKNQVYFLLNLMAECKVNHLSIEAIAFRQQFKYLYIRENYRDFMQKNFFLTPTKINERKISYIEYVQNKDQQSQHQQT